jgi:hypothetical protein
MDFLRLTLAAPLYYRKAAIQPGTGHVPKPGKEFLFHYEINPSEAYRIDPEPEQYLGPLLAAGIVDSSAFGVQTMGPADNAGMETPDETCLVLPSGLYYFTQLRKETFVSSELENFGNFVEMAMELQKEGLWERLRLGPGLYLRLLWEDEAGVVQVWRPCVPLSDIHSR